MDAQERSIVVANSLTEQGLPESSVEKLRQWWAEAAPQLIVEQRVRQLPVREPAPRRKPETVDYDKD